MSLLGMRQAGRVTPFTDEEMAFNDAEHEVRALMEMADAAKVMGCTEIRNRCLHAAAVIRDLLRRHPRYTEGARD